MRALTNVHAGVSNELGRTCRVNLHHAGLQVAPRHAVLRELTLHLGHLLANAHIPVIYSLSQRRVGW